MGFKRLGTTGLDDCRSECYENAAVMSDHISGVQQRILEKNPQALFINCDNHSLNLAGVHSASQEPLVVTIFGTPEMVYLFFACSTLRWENLKQVMSITVKWESETCWKLSKLSTTASMTLWGYSRRCIPKSPRCPSDFNHDSGVNC